MKISILTPNFNGERYLEPMLDSVGRQRRDGVDLEWIVVDGGSTDRSLDILRGRGSEIDRILSEPDRGPASAINKGLALARGDLLGWLNADDLYHPGALARVCRAFSEHPDRALGFGGCRIIDESGVEIRKEITRFKAAFHPFSCRFLIQSINYVSQPAMFFRRTAWEKAGPLREDLKAAFDYEFLLRLWRQGGAFRIPGPPLADFRWHPNSISGSGFQNQFREELEAARQDAGRWAPQVLIHEIVRLGIVGCYSRMAARRRPFPEVEK
ncbi:MAG: glycosyltransferase family 2 protein [Kiritimatiellia bacterium]|nr:glycosyltransferase family 2 protein [Kiritimatiellia bacterium]